MRAIPLRAKHAASPKVSVESPIKAIGPRINSQLNLFENKSSELTQTSCMRLCGAAGGVDGDAGVTVMMELLCGGLDKNRDQRFLKPRGMQQK